MASHGMKRLRFDSHGGLQSNFCSDIPNEKRLASHMAQAPPMNQTRKIIAQAFMASLSNGCMKLGKTISAMGGVMMKIKAKRL